MAVLAQIWSFIVFNFLTNASYFIGLIVLIGYILLKRKWYESLAGFIKAAVGFMILGIGSGGLVGEFKPIMAALQSKFGIDAIVNDPYFGQNAVQEGLEAMGKSFSQVMILLLIAFIVNLVLVRFNKQTKLRAVFTTGHVQMQQASIGIWFILFAFPELGETPLLITMALILGSYWAVGSNLTVKPTQDLTDGAGFCIAHQQMFGIYLADKFGEWVQKKSKGNAKRFDEMELPGWLQIFNENMVSTALIMFIFMFVILLVLGKDYLVSAGMISGDGWYASNGTVFFYALTKAFKFAAYLAVLQLGVRTFVGELTISFNGISDRLLPGAVVGVDCAVVYGFATPNAVTMGFIAGAIGQTVAIIGLIVFHSPVLVIAGFVPVFFDNATLAVFAHNKGGAKAGMIFPFFAGILQILGAALMAGWTGLAAYGGYLGMFDWVSVWPVFTVLMTYLQWIGVAIIVIGLLAIPQIQAKKAGDDYLLITEDYEAYKAKHAAK